MFCHKKFALLLHRGGALLLVTGYFVSKYCCFCRVILVSNAVIARKTKCLLKCLAHGMGSGWSSISGVDLCTFTHFYL